MANTLLFTETEVTAPADVAFTLTFDNQDAGVPHDVVINDSAGTQVFKTDTFPGAESRSFTVGPLAAGSVPVPVLGASDDHDRDPDSRMIDRAPDHRRTG